MLKNPTTISFQMLAFSLVGILAIGVDYIGYWLLRLFLNLDWAKGLSYIAGIGVVYVGNKFWTFDQPHKSPSETFKFCMLYVATFCINVWVNHVTVFYLANYKLMFMNPYFWGFIVSTAVTAIINFIAQKWWVFRKKAL
jgi:putative flippase GtrA